MLAPSRREITLRKAPQSRGPGSTLAAFLGALAAVAAVAASLWVGSSTSEAARVANQVADETRRDVVVAQRSAQFTSALEQISSPAPEIQHSGILALGALMESDANVYLMRGCSILKSVVGARMAVPRPLDVPQRAAKDVPLIASLNLLSDSCAKRIPITFVGLDLSGANLFEANLSDLHLDRANLEGANLQFAKLSSTALGHSNLTGAVLDGANLTRADLSFSILDKARARGSRLSQAILVHAQLRDVDLSDSDLKDCNASGGAILVGANLIGSDLSGANLSDSNLFGANLTGATLLKTQLVRANLRQASLDPNALTTADTFGMLR